MGETPHMEPQHLIRTIRRRWRPILLLAAVGGGLGAASAAVAEDAAPPEVPVVFYDACHTLLVESALPSDVEVWDVRNLAQLAERVTQGAIPAAVAAAVGADATEVSTRVRVRVRNDIQSLSICTVGETPMQAELLADEFASALLEALDADAAEFYSTSLVAVQDRVAEAEACKSAAEAGTEAALIDDPFADVSVYEQQENTCNLRLLQARSTLNSVESNGVRVVPFDTLEAAEANEITEYAFDSRVREGAAGANVAVGVGDAVGVSSPSTSSEGSGPPIPDSPLTRGAIGLVVGAGLGFGWIQFTERLDSRLRRKEDVESTLDLPVLAEIPPLARRDRKHTRIVSVEEPRSRSAESYRALRSTLDYARMIDEEHGRARPGAQVVMITSGGPSEGKTTTLSNLAAVMAEGDRRVLAVNCDFRRPRLHRYLGGPTDAQTLNVTDVPGVQLVTQVTADDGDSSPSDVIAAQRRLVDRAREHFDVILLDTAPILTTNDATELLTVADHVVLVVSAGHTKAEAAARATELLERRGRPPLGVALIGTRDVPNSSEYYYSDDDPYLVQSKRRNRGRRRSEQRSPSEPDAVEVQAGG